MISVKEAVQVALRFVQDLFPEARDLRLEEVELFAPDWQVVVSFIIEGPTTLSSVMGVENRQFKLVKVDMERGTGLAVKVWKK